MEKGWSLPSSVSSFPTFLALLSFTLSVSLPCLREVASRGWKEKGELAEWNRPRPALAYGRPCLPPFEPHGHGGLPFLT